MAVSTNLIAFALLTVSTVAAAAGRVAIDGGTLEIDGVSTRLWGIAAPAAGENCRTSSGAEWPCGARARDQLAAVAANEDIACEPKGDGTALCRAAGLDLGRLMVKEGLARSAGPYGDAEAAARAAHIGLWQ